MGAERDGLALLHVGLGCDPPAPLRVTGVVPLRTTGPRATAHPFSNGGSCPRGVSRRPLGCEILRRWLSTSYVCPTRARLPQSPSSSPSALARRTPARYERREGRGITFCFGREKQPAVNSKNSLSVIPGLVPGTHSSACSMRATNSKQPCTPAIIEQSARWLPVTSTGMTFVGVVIDASHPPAARQCAHLPRPTARVPDGAAHRACADPGSFPVSDVERPRVCCLPASSVRGHSTWEVWRPLDPL